MHAGLFIALWLAATAPTPLPAARQGYAQAQGALQSAHAAVSTQQAQLDALTGQIAAQKAAQAGQPALFVPGALEKKLAESQALSDALAQSRAAESARAAELERARGGLYEALSGRISALQDGHTLEAAALTELRQLEAERAAVAPRAAGEVAAPHFQGQSDDPRELRERADALRDQADKLARQEAALQARIQAAQDQAQLEKRLARLGGDDALFDESDRRVRVSRTDTSGAAVAASPGTTLGGNSVAKGTTGGTGASAAASTTHPAVTQDASAFSSSSPTDSNQVGGSASPVLAPTPTASAGAPTAQAAASATEVPAVHTGELVRPEDLGRSSAGPADGEEESVAALLKARARLQQQRAALESQARALESQAGGK